MQSNLINFDGTCRQCVINDSTLTARWLTCTYILRNRTAHTVNLTAHAVKLTAHVMYTAFPKGANYYTNRYRTLSLSLYSSLLIAA